METKAIVSSVNKNDWELLTEDNNYIRAQINKKYRGNSLPLVGDRVLFETDIYGNNLILDYSKRMNTLKRFYNGETQKIASNVDVVFIVSSLNKEFSIEKLERLAILGLVKNARICFVLTKKDLIDNYLEYELAVWDRFPNSNVISVNALDSKEVSLIKQLWNPGETAIFIGASGVGKSTIINSLLEKEVQKTGAIREKDSKGRHTTTARNLLIDQDGRFIIDTPGIRSIQITNDNFAAQDIFPNIVKLESECRFNDCAHTPESKGCAVWDAINNGYLDIETYQRYLKLKKKEENTRSYYGQGPKLSRYEKERLCKQKKHEDYGREK